MPVKMQSIAASFIKLIPLLLCLAGAVTTLYSIVEYCGSSIPYQDAPDDLLVRQQMDLHSAAVRMRFGIAVYSTGFLLGAIQLYIIRKNKSRHK